LTYPKEHNTAPESALAEYLEFGRTYLASLAEPSLVNAGVSDDFDSLRWFELPEESVR
jgi:hypothetical protein